MTNPEEQAPTNPPENSTGPEPQPTDKQPPDDPLRPTRLKSPFVPGELKKRDCLNCQKTIETRSGYCPNCGQDLSERSSGELITGSARADAVLGFLTVLGLVFLAFGISMGLAALVARSDPQGIVAGIVGWLSLFILTPVLGVLVPVVLQRRLQWKRPAYVRGLHWGTVVVATLVLGAYAVCAGFWMSVSL